MHCVRNFELIKKTGQLASKLPIILSVPYMEGTFRLGRKVEKSEIANTGCR